MGARSRGSSGVLGASTHRVWPFLAPRTVSGGTRSSSSPGPALHLGARRRLYARYGISWSRGGATLPRCFADHLGEHWGSDVHWKGTFARPDRQRRVDLVFALSLALADSRVRKNTDWREPVLSRDGACSPGLRLHCLGVAALRGAPVQKKDPAPHTLAGAKRVRRCSRSDGDCRIRFLTEPRAHLPSQGRNHAGRTTGTHAARRPREPPYARVE